MQAAIIAGTSIPYRQPSFAAAVPTMMGDMAPPTLRLTLSKPQYVPRSAGEYHCERILAHAGKPTDDTIPLSAQIKANTGTDVPVVKTTLHKAARRSPMERIARGERRSATIPEKSLETPYTAGKQDEMRPICCSVRLCCCIMMGAVKGKLKRVM